ncbi:MAG: ABC transporter permease [Candidatus Eisenbacteria bacterium]|nr:ABC transporter permease [Candidatus Eisenbacteria bacterium]
MATPRPRLQRIWNRLGNIREAVAMALSTIRVNKMRSFLTMLGVFIGVSSVIAMGSCIEGLNRSMAKQISSLGSETIRIRRFPPFHGGNLPDSLRARKFFNLNDVDGIRRSCPAVGAVSILMLDGDRLKFRGTTSGMTDIYGADEAFPEIQSVAIERGRFYNEGDIERRMRVCVIGSDHVEALFPGIDPLGQWITAKGQKFEVIGVFARRGKFLGQTMDDMFVIPYTTFEKMIDSRRMIIDARPRTAALLPAAMDQITDSLRRTRGVSPEKPNDFELFTSDQLMSIYKQITGAFYIVMLAISGIALLVGGIGVMNIMLVAVTERTREIGIRKAIGAKNSDILWQFLIEAMTLTGLGGILGILFGAGVGQLVRMLTPLPSYVPPMAAIAGFTFSVGIGLFFGIWPAAKAARLHPVDALRYE